MPHKSEILVSMRHEWMTEGDWVCYYCRRPTRTARGGKMVCSEHLDRVSGPIRQVLQPREEYLLHRIIVWNDGEEEESSTTP